MSGEAGLRASVNMRETTFLEIRLKLYHAQGLGPGRQHLMAEAPEELRKIAATLAIISATLQRMGK